MGSQFLLENNNMKIWKIIKQKLFVYYLKKGIIKAMKDLEDKNKEGMTKAHSNINEAIILIKEEVEIFSKAITEVELKYGKNIEAAEYSTIFPFLYLSNRMPGGYAKKCLNLLFVSSITIALFRVS